MKQFIILLLFSANVFAQSSDAVLYFSIIDTNGLDQNALLSKVVASPILNQSLASEVEHPINFHADENLFSLQIPYKYAGNIIQIQLQKQAGNSIEVMNLYYKSAKENDPTTGCHSCLCVNIIFAPGNFIFDMPMQAASWPLLPDVEKDLSGGKIILKDISILQNWREQKMK
ncbi:MAG: hypothetical protein ACKVPJ_12325 [Chitinophagales bacterium]